MTTSKPKRKVVDVEFIYKEESNSYDVMYKNKYYGTLLDKFDNITGNYWRALLNTKLDFGYYIFEGPDENVVKLAVSATIKKSWKELTK